MDWSVHFIWVIVWNNLSCLTYSNTALVLSYSSCSLKVFELQKKYISPSWLNSLEGNGTFNILICCPCVFVYFTWYCTIIAQIFCPKALYKFWLFAWQTNSIFYLIYETMLTLTLVSEISVPRSSGDWHPVPAMELLVALLFARSASQTDYTCSK